MMRGMSGSGAYPFGKNRRCLMNRVLRRHCDVCTTPVPLQGCVVPQCLVGMESLLLTCTEPVDVGNSKQKSRPPRV